MTIPTATGTVKFFNVAKGFGFIAVEGLSCDVFFHITTLGRYRENLTEGSVVDFEYMEEYKGGAWKKALTRVIAVAPPVGPERHEVWAMVDWYNQKKGLGFVLLHEPLSGIQAALFQSVCNEAGVIPSAEMPMKAVVEKGPKGWKVVSFDAGPAITDESKSKRAAPKSTDEVPTDDPVLRPKGKKDRKAKASETAAVPAKKPARKKIVRRTDPLPDTAIAAAFLKAEAQQKSVH